jgi:glycosyltransferase involved in cell wall biosynthesis
MEPRILYVIGQLRRGGAEQQLYYLLKYLRPKARVVALSEGGYWADPIRGLGVEVVELHRKGSWDFSRLYSLTMITRAYRPDIVHVFLDNVPGLYGRLAALLGNAKVISGERADTALQQPGWYRALKRLLNRNVAAVVCNSQSNYRNLLDQKISSVQKLSYIPNGLELDRFPERDESTNGADHGAQRRLVVGTVGSLVSEKSPEVFIRAAATIMSEHPEVRFVHIGEGPLKLEMEALTRELGIRDRLQFLGQRDDVPKLLAEMDMFVLTSKTEGLPNAIMEAMAAGLPCVATDAGGCRELVHEGETGFVVPIGDEIKVVERILLLLRNKELRRTMGLKGKEAMVNFDVRRMAEQYRLLYTQIMGTQVN